MSLWDFAAAQPTYHEYVNFFLYEMPKLIGDPPFSERFKDNK